MGVCLCVAGTQWPAWNRAATPLRATVSFAFIEKLNSTGRFYSLLLLLLAFTRLSKQDLKVLKYF